MFFSLKDLFKKKRGRIVKRWEFDCKSHLLTKSVVEDIDNDGKKEIIFGTKSGELFVLQDDCKLKWVFDVKEDIGDVEMLFLDSTKISSIAAPPIVVDINEDKKKEIIFGTELGIVYALNNKGKLLWKFKAGGSIKGGILSVDVNNDYIPELVFGCGDRYLYAITNKGELMWKYDAKARIESRPELFGNDQIIFGCNDGNIHSINKNAELNWKFKTMDRVIAQPAVADLFKDGQKYIVIGSTDNTLYVLDKDGDLIWKYTTEGAICSKACIIDINEDNRPEIIFGACDNNVYALYNNGDKFWSYETGFWIVDQPLIYDINNDGKPEVVVGSYDSNIYILRGEGNFILDYVPGLSGMIQQTGIYSNIITKDPGEIHGKKLWQFKTESVVVGCSNIPKTSNIIVNTQKGKINNLAHSKD